MHHDPPATTQMVPQKRVLLSVIPLATAEGGGEGGAGVLAERTEEREISGSWRFVGALAKVRRIYSSMYIIILLYYVCVSWTAAMLVAAGRR